MSPENVEIVRRVYEGWSRGDFSGSELFDADVEFEMIDWPHPTKSRGLAAMREAWLTTLGAWEDFRARPDEVIDHGDHILVLNSISGRGRGSGADVSALTATVWTVESGKVVRLALYWDVERAREAAAEGRD
jgi:ketosteroid isomerase-like protein